MDRGTGGRALGGVAVSFRGYGRLEQGTAGGRAVKALTADLMTTRRKRSRRGAGRRGAHRLVAHLQGLELLGGLDHLDHLERVVCAWGGCCVRRVRESDTRAARPTGLFARALSPRIFIRGDRPSVDRSRREYFPTGFFPVFRATGESRSNRSRGNPSRGRHCERRARAAVHPRRCRSTCSARRGSPPGRWTWPRPGSSPPRWSTTTPPWPRTRNTW